MVLGSTIRPLGQWVSLPFCKPIDSFILVNLLNEKVKWPIQVTESKKTKPTPSSKTSKTLTLSGKSLHAIISEIHKGKHSQLGTGCEIQFYSVISSKFVTSTWQNAPKFSFDYANCCNKHLECENRIIYSTPTFNFWLTDCTTVYFILFYLSRGIN